MRVIELASRCTPERMLEEYEAAYGTTHGHSPASVGEWLRRMAAAVPVRSEMQVVIRLIPESKFNPEHYDVGGVVPGDPTNWAIDFTSWGQWREMEVVDTTNSLTTDQLAAHVFYEMTWHGWPEDIEEKHQGLLDKVEQLNRDLASGQPLEQLGYTEMTPEYIAKLVAGSKPEGEGNGG